MRPTCRYPVVHQKRVVMKVYWDFRLASQFSRKVSAKSVHGLKRKPNDCSIERVWALRPPDYTSASPERLPWRAKRLPTTKKDRNCITTRGRSSRSAFGDARAVSRSALKRINPIPPAAVSAAWHAAESPACRRDLLTIMRKVCRRSPVVAPRGLIGGLPIGASTDQQWL